MATFGPALIKYPRTRHLADSALQAGDDGSDRTPFSALALLLSATAFSTAEAIHWKREARQAAGLSAILLSVARAEHAHSLDLKREFGKRGWCV